MDLIQRISRQFEDSSRCTLESLEWLAAPIAGAVETLTGCLLNSGRILTCGSGQSALDAHAFAATLMTGFELERPPLAAIALGSQLFMLPACTQAGNAAPRNTEPLFAQQISALGQPGDALLLLDPEGRAAEICAAIDTAHELDMRIIALTGSGDTPVGERLHDHDIHVCVPAETPARIREVHRVVLHCLCDGIDCLLLGVEEA